MKAADMIATADKRTAKVHLRLKIQKLSEMIRVLLVQHGVNKPPIPNQ